MVWTGTLRGDLEALGGIPAEREDELFYGMFVLDLSVEDAVAYIKADVPIITYVAACDRSWTVEEVMTAWNAGVPTDYVRVLGPVPQEETTS